VRWLALAIGCAVLLGLGIVLWSMTRVSDGSTPKPTQGPVAEGSSESAPAQTPTPAIRSPQIKDVVKVAPTQEAQPSGGAAAPVLVDAGPEFVYVTDNEMKNDLRDQMKAKLDKPVKECVAKAAKYSRITGSANVLVGFTRDEKEKISVRFEADTTIKDQALLDCLSEASKKLELKLPDDVQYVAAWHLVELDNAKLTSDKLSAFYAHRVDPALIDAGPR
jgi:hypothetical protein